MTVLQGADPPPGAADDNSKEPFATRSPLKIGFLKKLRKYFYQATMILALPENTSLQDTICKNGHAHQFAEKENDLQEDI